MIGIVVATIMILCRVKLDSALLAFIGFELFGISFHLNYFHREDERHRNSLRSFLEGMRKGLADARRNAEDNKRDKDGNGE